MKRIVATGTFDILHPGHIYYLEQSKKLGGELWVIIAREQNIIHKPKPIIPEMQRMQMISSLRCVDHAILGDTIDRYKLIKEINPDIITLGFNQMFSEDKLISELRERSIQADVVRIGKYTDCSLSSSSNIINEILKRRDNQ